MTERSPIGIAALAALLVAACSGSARADGDRGVTGLRDGAFEPIEGMEASTGQQPLSPEDGMVIYRAEERLVAACMRQQGFTFATTLEQAVTPPPAYLSPTELRRSGYQHDWQAAAERYLELNGPSGPPDPTAGMTDHEVAAYEQALVGPADGPMAMLEDVDGGRTGVPAGGCLGEARAELFGSVANYLRFIRADQSLSGVGRELREQDAYREPMAAWQGCMRQAGHDVGDEIDYGVPWIQARGADALQSGGLGQTAITLDSIGAVAEADADCQESSGLYEVRRDLLPDARDRVAATLGFELSQFVAFQHAVLERAKQVP
jgi:hypothetical protein